MASSNCPACGAPTAAGAQFCAYCGTALGSSAPTGPLPTMGAAVPPSAPGLYAPPPPPRRNRRRLFLVIVVVVVIIVAVAFLAAELYAPTADPIQVQYMLVWAPDNVCGLNSSPIYYDGYSASSSSVDAFEFTVPNANATTCTIVSATTNTTGFSLSDVQVPLAIPGNGNATMNITITSPGGSFNGNLSLVFE